MIDKNKMIEVSKNMIKHNATGTALSICKDVSCENCIFKCSSRKGEEELVKIAKMYLEDNEIYENKFNWQSFKQGEIEVNCTTERSARDFLKQCDEKGIVWSGGTKIDDNTSWHHNKENTLYSTISGNLVFGYKLSTDNKAIIWNIKENINMKTEKTFKEVIADIKEGEVWESLASKENYTERKIYINESGNIVISNISNNTSNVINKKQLFCLQRKQYTFTEAFAAYEEGKEIESCVSGREWGLNILSFDTFTIEEIRNKWYINN